MPDECETNGTHKSNRFATSSVSRETTATIFEGRPGETLRQDDLDVTSGILPLLAEIYALISSERFECLS
jgi:hypothetical protein